jgi:hypothetical protein
MPGFRSVQKSNSQSACNTGKLGAQSTIVRHPNHDRAFYSLFSDLMPGWKGLKTRLKEASIL